jgi:hypothetical protein
MIAKFHYNQLTFCGLTAYLPRGNPPNIRIFIPLHNELIKFLQSIDCELKIKA